MPNCIFFSLYNISFGYKFGYGNLISNNLKGVIKTSLFEKFVYEPSKMKNICVKVLQSILRESLKNQILRAWIENDRYHDE